MRFIITLLLLTFSQSGWNAALFSYDPDREAARTSKGIYRTEFLVDPKNLKVGDEIDITTPDGKHIVYTVEKATTTNLGNWLVTAKSYYALSRLNLVIGEDDHAVIRFNVGFRRYQMDSNQGFLRLVDVKATGVKMLPIDDGPVMPTLKKDWSGASVKKNNSRSSRSSEIAIIDMLFYYDDSVDGLLAAIDSVVATANNAFSDSGILIEVRVVHAVPIPLDDRATLYTTLAQVRDREGGFENLEQLLEDYQADAVHALVGPVQQDVEGDACGLATVSIINGLKLAEFRGATHFNSDGGWGCPDLVFAHEFGHNLGSTHNRKDSINDDGNLSVPAFPYSFGHRVDGVFRTVMAYQSDVSEPRVGFFSNPEKTCADNLPCGVSIGDVGEADNRTGFNAVRFLAAGVRGDSFSNDSVQSFKYTPTCEAAGRSGYYSGHYIQNSWSSDITPGTYYQMKSDGSIYDSYDAKTAGDSIEENKNIGRGLCITDGAPPFASSYWTYENPVTGAMEESERLYWASSYTVTVKSDENGNVTPKGNISINSGDTLSLSASPASEYQVSYFEGTCGGTRSGTGFVTNPVTNDCSVTARFKEAVYYTVTPSAGAGGTISPSTAQSVISDATTSFTITPNTDYAVSDIEGTCGGTLSVSGSNYTYLTDPITDDCTVNASFILGGSSFSTSEIKSSKSISSCGDSGEKIYRAHTITNKSNFEISLESYGTQAGSNLQWTVWTPEELGVSPTLSTGSDTTLGLCEKEEGHSMGSYWINSRWQYQNPVTGETEDTILDWTPKAGETAIHSTIPGSICKANDPGTSIKLQSRETGLTNTESSRSIVVACPVSLPFTSALDVIGDVLFSVNLSARTSNTEVSNMACSLNEYRGQELLSSKEVQIPLTLDEDTSGAIAESTTVSRLSSFTIKCDLPAQTAITSLETKTVY